MAGRLLLRAAILLVIGAGAGAAHSALRPVKLRPDAPLPGPAAPEIVSTPDGVAAPADAASAEAAMGLEITVSQAAALYDQGVSFVDSRHLAEFEGGHVENAFLMAAEDFLGGGTPVALGLLDPAAPLVVYCGGGDCDASKNLVLLLQQAGFRRAHIMTDGFPAWAAAGHPVATGGPTYGEDGSR